MIIEIVIVIIINFITMVIKFIKLELQKQIIFEEIVIQIAKILKGQHVLILYL